MDCVLIQHGKAHEIWRNTFKVTLQGLYTPEILDVIVETADGAVQAGDVWNGSTFTPPPPAPDTTLPAARDAATDAALNAIIDDVLTALLEKWTAIQADAQAGALNVSVWKQQIRARVKALRRV